MASRCLECRLSALAILTKRYGTSWHSSNVCRRCGQDNTELFRKGREVEVKGADTTPTETTLPREIFRLPSLHRPEESIMTLQPIEQQTHVITCSTSGIGLATASRPAENGT